MSRIMVIIRTERLKRGWSQEYLGELLNVSKTTVRSWEAGRRYPGLESQRRLLALFNMTAEELAFDEIPKEDKESEKIENIVVPKPLTRVAFINRDRSRQQMLNLIRSRWIKGFLDRMGPSSLMTLQLRMQSSGVDSIWRELGDPGVPSSIALPEGTSIVQVYDDTSGELLVLGEPGAGKTTQLLLLARELIERAALDAEHPIPVIFNLSSWSEKKDLLINWLIGELHEKYQVPIRLAQSWIEQDTILPLLDGLDEVSQHDRPACVSAINIYRQGHGLLPVVVCCRIEDYYEIPVKLVLGDAVILEVLSLQQIDAYIKSQGEALVSLRAALQRDHSLADMIATPLMLSVMAQAYSGKSLDDVLAAETMEERRYIIFNRYIQRVLARGSRKYSEKQVVTFLSWLAHQMRDHNQTEFYVEQLQPDWLAGLYRIRYRSAVSRIVFSLQAVILYTFTACLRGPNVLTGGFPFIISDKDLLGWMSPGLGGIFQGTASLQVMWIVIAGPMTYLIFQQKLPDTLHRLTRGIWQASWYGLVTFLLVGVVSVLLFLLNAPAGANGSGIVQGIGLALFAALLIFFLILWLSFIRGDGYKEMDRNGKKELKRVRRPFFQSPVVNSFIVSLVGAAAFIIVYTLQGERLAQAFQYGIANQLPLWLINYITVRPNDGFDLFHGDEQEGVITPVEVVSWSWSSLQVGLWRNSQKALTLGALYILWGGIFLGGMSALFHGWMYGLRFGLAYGVIIGLISGLAIFLTAIIKDLWSSDRMSSQEHNYPNVGIKLSARNGLQAAFIFGPCAGIGSGIACALGFGLIGQLVEWPILGTAFSIVFTLFFGYAFYFGFGGNVVIEHYVLRWYLMRAKIMPLDLVSFLDYAANHILLRKIGGGYIFIHRLLLEYFADLS